MAQLEAQRSEAPRAYVIEGRKDLEAARIAFGVDNMRQNKAYIHAAAAAGSDRDGHVLQQFQDRFRWYRHSWRGIPRQAIATGTFGKAFADLKAPPLCVDIESAAVCDLACPFCFRQWIATPDKIIDFDFYTRLIDQCAELGVPSVKLNWRGEPLLHPQLPQMIDYAKRNGILEVIINTNATRLDEKMSRELIDAGLDMMIYSFDGGTKETYEKMRPGRFKENSFDAVYANIRRFAEIRSEMGSVFPRTRIQMILTAETFSEQKSFFSLFEDCVDDVSVKAYTERGGRISDLDSATRDRLQAKLENRQLPAQTPFWRDIHGDLFISESRLPCEQPFQRMMVTYDGRVSMCCYDWGSQHPIGYADEEAYADGEREYESVLEKARQRKPGFEMMKEAVMPMRYNTPAERVQTLAQLWHGDAINDVREKQVKGCAGDLDVCSHCTFKETYNWIKVDDGE